MKRTFIYLSCLFIALMPLGADAQSNIRSAFDAIIKCKDAIVTESHTLEKDPDTGMKAGQSDIYHFVLPDSKMKLVGNLLSAFDKDRDKAYSFNQGQAGRNDTRLLVAVGDDSSNGVYVNEPESNYVYALFLPSQKEDPSGNHRYAYVLNYRQKNGKVTGKLAITYATTLKYRQQLESNRQYTVFNNTSNGGNIAILPSLPDINTSRQSWFDVLMSCFQGMTSDNSQTRIALATKAYKVIRDTSKYTDVTDADKNTVREILKGMISDKKYSETVLNKLLHQCLSGIK